MKIERRSRGRFLRVGPFRGGPRGVVVVEGVRQAFWTDEISVAGNRRRAKAALLSWAEMRGHPRRTVREARGDVWLFARI